MGRPGRGKWDIRAEQSLGGRPRTALRAFLGASRRALGNGEPSKTKFVVMNREEVFDVISHEPTCRRATRADVPDIVRMLADDVLGSQREQYTGCIGKKGANYAASFC